MLVLKRKSGEALMIGNNIYVKIVTVDNDRVKIAIEAPRSLNVYRTELIEAAAVNRKALDIPEETIEALQKIIQETS